MPSRILLLLFCLIAIASLSAQDRRVSLNAGVEFGWWLHQLGTPELGVAKTHHTGSPFISFSYLWKKGIWRFGPTARVGLFLEDDIRGPRDSRRRAHRVLIAKEDRFIPFIRYGLQVECQLIRRGAYSFAPALRYGPFQFWTIHPDADNFGYKHFTEVLFTHIWHRKKRDWLLQMNYNTQRIFLQESTIAEERHYLYSWGMALGMRF